MREILLVNREKLNALIVELLTKFDKDEKHCPEPGGSCHNNNTIAFYWETQMNAYYQEGNSC